jgi:hypothetical protein
MKFIQLTAIKEGEEKTPVLINTSKIYLITVTEDGGCNIWQNDNIRANPLYVIETQEQIKTLLEQKT